MSGWFLDHRGYRESGRNRQLCDTVGGCGYGCGVLVFKHTGVATCHV